MAGLSGVLAAIDSGKDIALANKESLVVAGDFVMKRAKAAGVTITPVDSEHSAIFQVLQAIKPGDLGSVILTASGGPFLHTPKDEFRTITPEQALKHPKWNMGAKISIDSATMMNKALEVIEAHWLFEVPSDSIEVIVHPQSIVHSMVEFSDSSVLAQLSRSDMCFPIQYAVTYPDRVPNSLAPLDFPALAKLDFEAPRRDVFPALDLAVRAGTEGGTLPAVFNAANEIAVAAFLDRRIAFPQIWQSVARVMDAHQPSPDDSLDAIIAEKTEENEALKAENEALAGAEAPATTTTTSAEPWWR
jgi:1-deoxy-D-xylulose-5-phosphate reductoisomerase